MPASVYCVDVVHWWGFGKKKLRKLYWQISFGLLIDTSLLLHFDGVFWHVASW